ncbi:MAG: winged helix DNA-binding domain-containing protein [Bacteroidia bacterium]
MKIRMQQLLLWPQQVNSGCNLLKQLGPVQAQGYTQGRRAIGLRLRNTTAAIIEKEIAEGKIIRSWMFRGTLHFAEAGQVREIQSALQPVVVKLLQPMLKNLGIDAAELKKATKVIEKHLSKNSISTRDEIGAVLEQNNIADANKQRLRYFLHYATATGLICHAPRSGSEDTFTLLDALLPASAHFVREDAVQNIVYRYFNTHGPASIADAVRWTGLPVSEIKKAVAGFDNEFEQALFGDEVVYFKNPAEPLEEIPLLLLAGFDEYIVGYKNRNHFLDSEHAAKVVTVNGLFHPSIVVNGRVQGIWKLESSGKELQLKLNLFSPLTGKQKQQLTAAVERLSTFEDRMITLM